MLNDTKFELVNIFFSSSVICYDISNDSFLRKRIIILFLFLFYLIVLRIFLWCVQHNAIIVMAPSSVGGLDKLLSQQFPSECI